MKLGKSERFSHIEEGKVAKRNVCWAQRVVVAATNAEAGSLKAGREEEMPFTL